MKKARKVAEDVFDGKFHRGSFKSLNQAKKDMLTDFAFNLGGDGLKKFKKFMTAIKEDDFEKAKEECIRKYKDRNGEKKPLLKRNRDFIRTFFDSGLFN